jgi:hypothetical protein
MLLFADETPDTGLGTDPTGDAFGYTKIANAFKEAMVAALDPSRYQSFFIKLEDQAVKTSRSLASNIAGYSQSLEKSMMNVYKQTVKIGGSTKDVIDYAEAFATQTGKVPAIQEEVIINAIAISKELGISTKEVAQMAGEFNKIGLSQMAAVKMIRTIGESARKYGVNAGKLTKVVQENVKKSAAYTFKDGIEGLTKMAAKAQSLNVGFESAFSMFDEFMDPDKAIEFASEMQMLGGDFASQFGDPFSNMGASVEELREKLTKAASASAVFNEKTGQFEIPREGLKALRLLSQKTGESMEDLATVATQSAKKMKVIEKTKWNSGISEEDKELVASFAQMTEGGAFEVKLPGTENWVKTSEITSKQIEELKKKTESGEAPLTEDKQAAFNEKFLSSAEKQNNTLIQIRDAVILRGGLDTGKDVAKIANTINESLGNAAEKIANLYPATKMKEIVNEAEIALTRYINTNFEAHLNKIIKGFEDVAKALGGIVPTIPSEDAFFPKGGPPKVMSEGQIYEGISGDEVMMGTNLSKGFEMSREQLKTMRVLADTFGVSMEDLKDPFKMMTVSNKPSTTLQNALGEKSTKLSEVMTTTTNTNINTTNTQNLSGGFTVTIDASKVPNSLDPTMLKNEMMKVMYQLNDEMKKQGVLNFKLK